MRAEAAEARKTFKKGPYGRNRDSIWMDFLKKELWRSEEEAPCSRNARPFIGKNRFFFGITVSSAR